MARELKIGDRMVGDGHPAYIIAEIRLITTAILKPPKK